MGHKLARKVGCNHIDMELIEMKIYVNNLHNRFNPAIGAEVPLTRSKQQLPCGVLQTEHHHGNSPRHAENTEEHLTEHFKVPASSHQSLVVLLCFTA